MRSLIKNKKGESLIELLMSVLLLSLISIAFLRAITSIVTMSDRNAEKLDGEFIAQKLMEYVTQHEGSTILSFQNTIKNSTEFECTVVTEESPYRFDIVFPEHPELLAILTVEYQYYQNNGHLSRVRINVYSDENEILCFMENAIYWK